MLTVIPWKDCPLHEFRGLLLQKRRSKKTGDLWGEILDARYEDRVLRIVLAWTTVQDPRREDVPKTFGKTEIKIIPRDVGPLYTGHTTFNFMDKEGFRYYILTPYRVLNSTGRPRKPVAGPTKPVWPAKKRTKPRFRPEFFQEMPEEES